jgi:XTP/dITP diphosphohydrolase
MGRRIVIATNNAGKAREFAAMIREAGLAIKVLSLRDIDPPVEMPEEIGATFAENARIKAEAVAATAALPALADDSGICVDALDGRPGIASARWAGPDATDADRNTLLLDELASIPATARTARFVCALALAEPGGRATVREGIWEGVIASEPRGPGGFGYDPLFLLPELGLTSAELGPDLKNRVSHRARAFAAMLPELARLA